MEGIPIMHDHPSDPAADHGSPADWPQKGGTDQHPWELAADHCGDEHTDDVYPQPYTGPGCVTHGHPTITTGAAGPVVQELVRLLACCGYKSNSVARGENPACVLDTSVMGDVHRFCQDYGVKNDAGELDGKEVPGHLLTDNYVGPYIWQALINVAQRDD